MTGLLVDEITVHFHPIITEMADRGVRNPQIRVSVDAYKTLKLEWRQNSGLAFSINDEPDTLHGVHITVDGEASGISAYAVEPDGGGGWVPVGNIFERVKP